MACGKCCALTGVFFFAPSLVLAFLVLLCVRLDGAAPSLPWPAVFAPLFAVAPFAFLAFAYFYTRSDRWADDPSCVGALFASLGAAALAAFAALVSLELQRPGAVGWAWAFAPLWAALGVALLVDGADFPRLRRRTKALHDRRSFFAVAAANAKAGLVLFALLVLLRLLGVVGHGVRPSLLFLPLVWAALVPLLLALRKWAAFRGAHAWVFGACAVDAVLLVGVVLVALYCDGSIRYLSVALVPVWACFAVLLVTSCCIISALS